MTVIAAVRYDRARIPSTARRRSPIEWWALCEGDIAVI